MAINFNNLYNLVKPGGLSSPSSSTSELTTSSIAPESSKHIELLASPVILVSKISVNYPCRLQFYSSRESRDLDAGRDINIDASLETGIMLDILLNEDALDVTVPYGNIWVNLENPQRSKFYGRVNNLDSNNSYEFIISLTFALITSGGGEQSKGLSLEDIWLYGGL